MREASQRAEAVRIPAATRELELAEAERQARLAQREALERRSVVRGLVILAVVVLLASIVHAGFGRVFVGRWWHP
jgi:hypothetical protein